MMERMRDTTLTLIWILTMNGTFCFSYASIRILILPLKAFAYFFLHRKPLPSRVRNDFPEPEAKDMVFKMLF